MESKMRYSYLTSEIDAAYHEAARKLGLSDSAMRILYTVCLHGDSCPLGDVVALAGISKQTINSALRKLEAAGILYLKTSGGRTKRVYLTEEGEALTRRSALRVLKMEDEILSSWPEEDWQTYVTLTEKYLSAFRAKVREL